jgi:hypothetical protein
VRPFQWLFCILGRHHRDGHQVMHDGIDFRGPCGGCGKPMIRTTAGAWIIARGEDAPPPV